ncbi:MAG: transposase [Stigonema ocellatum SAG 48.90 = DSM 106950]|nr:transposase [Stigonema ocellatum SAG 48.90 = DSM 106950]
MSRKVKGSNQYKKEKLKIAKIHKRISDIRLDATHKATSYIAKNHGKIVIEDLNVKGMMANHKLAGAVGDANFYEFRRQLEYKSKMYGSSVMVVDRFFPSTKKCSKCGYKQDMPLKERTFNCGGCGLSINRDLNAALNLEHQAYPS